MSSEKMDFFEKSNPTVPYLPKASGTIVYIRSIKDIQEGKRLDKFETCCRKKLMILLYFSLRQTFMELGTFDNCSSFIQ